MSRLPRIGFDLSLVVIATLAAIVLRTDLDLPSPSFVRYVPYLMATTLIAVTAIGGFKLDVGYWRHASLRDILCVVGVAALTASGSTAFVFGVNRLEGIARTIPVLQFVFIIVFLLAPRLVARCTAGHARHRMPFQTSDTGTPSQNVLIVGFNAISELYLRCLADAGEPSLRVAGLIGLERREAGRFVGQLPILGVLDDLPRVLSDLVVHGIVVNRIVVAVSPASLTPSARQAMMAVQRDHALTFDFLASRISGCDDLDRSRPARRAARMAVHLPEPSKLRFDLLELEARAKIPYWRMKRSFDIVGALVLMVVLAPVGIIAAVLAAVDVGVPLLFWQVRVGTGGAPFKLFKIRTMAAAYDPHGVRMPDDQRLSGVGALLRRTRLDELPQLWNVLVGDMSLIGPRPLLDIDQPSFESGRLLVRPGVTGWAQVCGGREIDADTKAALDVWYIRNASLKVDLQIVAATVRMMLLGERIEASKIERSQPAWARDAGVAAPIFQPSAVASRS